MALNTIEGCSRYFEDTVVPPLREKYPDLEYTKGKNCAWINFERTRLFNCLRKYNNMLVMMDPPHQVNHDERANMRNPPAIISVSLVYNNKRDAFRFDNLDEMIEKIPKLKSKPNEWCKVCVLILVILVVALILVVIGFCVE